MRRWLVLCLLLLLPLQAVWSAASALGLAEAPCMALQQHGANAEGDAPCPEAAATTCCEGACGTHCLVCDGVGALALMGAPVVPRADPATPRACGLRAGLPDHIPEQPLRPPGAGTR